MCLRRTPSNWAGNAAIAAREGDSAGVEAARADRDSGDANREELAREIGFEVCSTPRN